jgi:predicted house-cleaning noncanonical NTP pyrophosphatase (MazG superfamily)
MSSKLVRDRIPEIMTAAGVTPVVRIADSAEYWCNLRAKLQEEVSEFLDSENPEELADILEVVEALCLALKIDDEDMKRLKEAKKQARGGFASHLILDMG